MEIYHKDSLRANCTCNLRRISFFRNRRQDIVGSPADVFIRFPKKVSSFCLAPMFFEKPWCPSFRAYITPSILKKLLGQNLSLAKSLTFYCSPSCQALLRRCTVGLRSELNRFEMARGALHSEDCIHFRDDRGGQRIRIGLLSRKDSHFFLRSEGRKLMNKYAFAFCPELNRLVTPHEVRELVFGKNPTHKTLTFQCPEECCRVRMSLRRFYRYLSSGECYFAIFPGHSHKPGCRFLKTGDRRRKEYRTPIKRSPSSLKNNFDLPPGLSPFTESFPSDDAEMPSRIWGLITAYLERRIHHVARNI